MRLAKWEDRGYYAMKVTTERNQRQLHRLTRRAEQALSEPAAAVLAAASKAMGFADLTSPDSPPIGSSSSVEPPADQVSGSKQKKSKGTKPVSPEDAEAQAQVCLVFLSHDHFLTQQCRMM